MAIEKKDNIFIRQLCILTLVVFVASVFMRNAITVWWPALACFFFIVSLVVYLLSENAKRKDMRKFANFYLASTVVKMVVYLTIILIYAFTFKEDAKLFAMTFLAYYLVYSVFETYKLAKKDKKANE